MPDNFSYELRPLGKGYVRDDAITTEIRQVLSLSPEQLEQRIATGDLKSETLLYLLRETSRPALTETIFGVLYRRIAAQLRGRARQLNLDPEDVCQEIATRFYKLMTAPDPAAADFAEARFGLFIVRLWENYRRSAMSRMKNEMTTDSLDYEDDESPQIQLADRAAVDPVDRLVIAAALSELPIKIRDAFLLHHYYGWKITSNEPTEPTLTLKFGVSDRQIRNWFKRADEILSNYRRNGQ